MLAQVATVDGKPIPGIVFMRGDAIGVLVILECDRTEHTILTVQPRVPQGRSVQRMPALSIAWLPPFALTSVPRKVGCSTSPSGSPPVNGGSRPCTVS